MSLLNVMCLISEMDFEGITIATMLISVHFEMFPQSCNML